MDRTAMRNERRSGFTLVEIVISVALVVILMGVYFLAANPEGQLASGRNTKRQLDLQLIGNTIRENYTDAGNETFTCASGAIPTSSKIMASGGASGTYNIAPCIVLPQYGMYSMPYDPHASGTTAYYNSVSDYNSGYAISISASGTITLTAPSAELNRPVTVTR